MYKVCRLWEDDMERGGKSCKTPKEATDFALRLLKKDKKIVGVNIWRETK